MTDLPAGSNDRVADFYLEDAVERLRFQQEYTLAGFKTLILINGGAVIALLTYAGHTFERVAASSFKAAFGGYIGGLILAVSAYLVAYAGQALIMRHSTTAGLAPLGHDDTDVAGQHGRYKSAHRWIGFAIILCLLSLSAFIGGSLFALGAFV